MNAKEMISALEEFLLSNAGVKSVVVDGQTIQYDRKQAMDELNYWKREAAKQSGNRRGFRQIDLGRAW